jgi:hypothetical protein
MILTWKKIKEGIEGGEDGCTHTRNFERASYVAQIAPLMLPRGQWREGGGMMRVVLDAGPATMTARVRGSTPGHC